MNKDQLNLLLANLDEKVNLSVRKALEKHQKLGQSVVVSEMGNLKIYTGDEIQILLEKEKSKTD